MVQPSVLYGAVGSLCSPLVVSRSRLVTMGAQTSAFRTPAFRLANTFFFDVVFYLSSFSFATTCCMITYLLIFAVLYL